MAEAQEVINTQSQKKSPTARPNCPGTRKPLLLPQGSQKSGGPGMNIPPTVSATARVLQATSGDGV